MDERAAATYRDVMMVEPPAGLSAAEQARTWITSSARSGGVQESAAGSAAW